MTSAGYRLIGAACSQGAQDPGCAQGPSALRHADALQHGYPAHVLQQAGTHWGPTLYPRAGHGSRLAAIIDVCSRLADEVEATLQHGLTPCVLGGDHSVAIGTWGGVSRHLGPQRPFGLLWIDAHLDSHTRQSSYSGAIHGMPLAILLGHGDSRLLTIGGDHSKLYPQWTVVYGARSFEPEEYDLLTHLGVRVYCHDEIRQRGVSETFDEALAIVSQAPAGMGFSLDLDAIDPADAPGVGSPEHDGLRAEEIWECLRRLHCHTRPLCCEITEYNPSRDDHRRTARLVAELLAVLAEPAQDTCPASLPDTPA